MNCLIVLIPIILLHMAFVLTGTNMNLQGRNGTLGPCVQVLCQRKHINVLGSSWPGVLQHNYTQFLAIFWGNLA